MSDLSLSDVRSILENLDDSLFTGLLDKVVYLVVECGFWC
jgi:hypothetical protein